MTIVLYYFDIWITHQKHKHSGFSARQLQTILNSSEEKQYIQHVMKTSDYIKWSQKTLL